MRKEATFGAGCFWCIEACFKNVEGVLSASPGYMGGDAITANYKDVCSGKTNHAEVARVVYDDEQISYDKLLEMFWFVHNPTQLNRQGNDVGPQYRSVIFYHNEGQRDSAETYVKKLTAEKIWEDPIVTEITMVKEFFPAENYHENYFELNPDNQYCQFVVRPKVDKFKKVFSE